MGKKNKHSSYRERSLDLHGIIHSEVPLIVENYILITPTPFVLITGNSHKMKLICTALLDTHKFKYNAKGTFFNPGTIEVFS